MIRLCLIISLAVMTTACGVKPKALDAPDKYQTQGIDYPQTYPKR